MILVELQREENARPSPLPIHCNDIRSDQSCRISHIQRGVTSLVRDNSYFRTFWLEIIQSIPYINGRATTQGVFKAYAFCFFIKTRAPVVWTVNFIIDLDQYIFLHCGGMHTCPTNRILQQFQHFTTIATFTTIWTNQNIYNNYNFNKNYNNYKGVGN